MKKLLWEKLTLSKEYRPVKISLTDSILALKTNMYDFMYACMYSMYNAAMQYHDRAQRRSHQNLKVLPCSYMRYF